ncbi:hypothetical protein J4217_00430 [Candidatus Pacearchaeota archaeon]|nr:hypothetical protein [Candidatus Pacearchaeota archaeon]
MLPRWHIFLGLISTILITLVFPNTSMLYLLLFFLSSFLIDFDHYANAAMKTNKLGLRNAFEYHKILGEIEKEEHKKGLRRKGDFHPFHTIEFHLLVLLLGFLWTSFFFIFLGMLFHSIMDLISIQYKGYLYRREFFFLNWLRKKVRR